MNGRKKKGKIQAQPLSRRGGAGSRGGEGDLVV